MSLSQILDKVEEITKRPDARARALTSLNAVIQSVTQNADYPEDLIEHSVTLNPAEVYHFQLPLSFDNLPAVRKIEYLLAGGKLQTPTKPRNAVLSSGCAAPDTYYRANNLLQVNCSMPATIVYIGYYQQTGFLAELDTHWLETAAEHVLILGTAASVFRATGDDTSAVEYEGQYRIARQEFRRMRADSEDL